MYDFNKFSNWGSVSACTLPYPLCYKYIVILNLLLFIFSIIVLTRSATWLVTSLTRIASFLHLTEFTVSFVLMSLATSLPELFIAISAAWQDSEALTLGNVVGSNIANLTLALGVAALLSRGIRVRRITQRKDAVLMSIIGLMPMILLYDGVLSRYDGLVLIIAYMVYLFRLIRQKPGSEERVNSYGGSVLKPVLEFVLGTGLLIASAYLLVYSSAEVATSFNISMLLVGFSLVALGTSLPEISFASKAILSHHRGMVFGGTIGSVVTNSSLVLGTAALIRPIYTGYPPQLLVSAAFLTVTIFIFNMFIRTRMRLSWGEGFTLFLLYIAFLVVEFSL